jgi:glutathione S-transferase
VLWEGQPGKGFATWETLAIAERLHELNPDRGIWPADAQQRARARSGAQPRCTVDFAHCARDADEHSQQLSRQGQERRRRQRHRADHLDLECRAGAFLFGEFCAADAFFAPVASRFVTYGVELKGAARGYQLALLDSPGVREWTQRR